MYGFPREGGGALQLFPPSNHIQYVNKLDEKTKAVHSMVWTQATTQLINDKQIVAAVRNTYLF